MMLSKITRRRRKVKIHHEGTEIIIIFLFFLAIINGLLLAYTSPYVSYTVLILTTVLMGLIINFFRSPLRIYNGEVKDIVLAPADGKIVVIEEVMENEYFHDKRLMVSIFMSIFNVHANWYPCVGQVKHVDHHDGNFLAAWLPKASTENERSMVVIETPEGKEVMARQIAGAMARRIVTYSKVGESCDVDEHLGFIKFGSRVDVYLPIGTEVCVTNGQVVTGNQTIIAKLK